MDKKRAVMEERMPGGKSKTVVYPFDEAVNYTNEGHYHHYNDYQNISFRTFDLSLP